MKFYNVTKKTLDSLFNEIDKCEGEVELVAKDGTMVDAKKNLSTLKKVSGAFVNNSVSEMELFAANSKDNRRLINFMVRGIA